VFERQNQKQEGSGTAIQAGQSVTINVVNQGLQPDQVRQMLVDVMRANLLDYRGRAQQTAVQRGERITDAFLHKLNGENPDGLRQAETPDFQDALFTVQKEYAKAGDEDLGDLLVDLLVDRTKQEDRNVLQLVLNEALHTAPKLTKGQMATLSIVFLMRYTAANNLEDLQAFANYYKRLLGSLVADAATNQSAFQHLEFAGCGTISIAEAPMHRALTVTYPGLFCTGFDQARLDAANLSEGARRTFIIPCLNDPAKFQVNALRPAHLDEKLKGFQASDEERQQLNNLLIACPVDAGHIELMLDPAAPFFREVFRVWDSTSMKKFTLTSVGMAIGHANIKRFTGEFAPLSIWVN
jgi:hypothetical protein